MRSISKCKPRSHTSEKLKIPQLTCACEICSPYYTCDVHIFGALNSCLCQSNAWPNGRMQTPKIRHKHIASPNNMGTPQGVTYFTGWRYARVRLSVNNHPGYREDDFPLVYLIDGQRVTHSWVVVPRQRSKKILLLAWHTATFLLAADTGGVCEQFSRPQLPPTSFHSADVVDTENRSSSVHREHGTSVLILHPTC